MFEASSHRNDDVAMKLPPTRMYRRQHDSFTVHETRAPSPESETQTTEDERQQEESTDSVIADTSTTTDQPLSAQTTIDPYSQDYIGYTSVEAGLEAFQQTKYEEALLNFEAAYRRQKILVPDDSAVLAMSLGNIGITKMKLNKLDEAEAALVESLNLNQMKKSRSCARVLNNLAAVKAKKGEINEARDMYRRALKELEEKGGKRSEAADALFNIGRIEIQLESWEVAYGVLTEAWRITREVYGEAHDYVAETLDMLGFVQVKLKDFKTSMISFTGSLAIYRRVHGPLHETVANALYNIGWVREKIGEKKDALEAYSTARELYLRLGKSENSEELQQVSRRVHFLEQEEKEAEKKLETVPENTPDSDICQQKPKETERKGILRKATQFARNRSRSRTRSRRQVQISV